MTYTLTAAQRKTLQRRLGIGVGEDVLKNVELDENFDEAGGDLDKATVISLRQMLGDASRKETYTLGLSGINKQETFDNLEKLLARWERIAGMTGGRIRTATLDYGMDQPVPEEWS